MNLGDGRAEIADIQREEVDAYGFAAFVSNELLDPAGGDLAVVVVRGEDIDPFAGLAHGIRNEGLDLLGGRNAVDEDVPVADSAFVKHIVEVERL